MSAPDFAASNFYSDATTPLRKERRIPSRAFFATAMAFSEVSADLLVCIAGIVATNFACESFALSVVGRRSMQSASALGAALGLVVVLLLHRDGAYRKDCGVMQIRETERTLRVTAQALFLLFALTRLLGIGLFWPEFFVALVIVPVFLIGGRFLFLTIAQKLRNGRPAGRVVVYGAGEMARRAISTLLQSCRLGLQPVAVIDDDSATGMDSMLEMGYRGRRTVAVLHGLVTAARLKSLAGDLLLLATPNPLSARAAEIADTARQIGMDLAILRLSSADELQATDIEIDGALFASSKERSRFTLYELGKRITDVFVALILLAVLSPVLFLIAVMIRFDSRGPALFVQKRIGRNGVPFDMYKFRSMYAGAPKYALSPTSSTDPRITPIGRLLRRLSLDELPQLINVILGNMSLVGPRPEMPFIVERYDDRQRQRLQVPPGITGLWQLSADRTFPIHQNLEYDFYYVRNRSWCMDAAILVHTLVFALCGGV